MPMVAEMARVAGKAVVVYGELFGGGKETKPVQREIEYNDGELDFCAFDVAVDGRGFVNVLVAETLCKSHGIPFIKILKQGTFDDCMAFDENINTGYSSKEQIAEGVVVRPNSNAYFGNGERVIFKNRTAEFLEKKKGQKKKKSAGINVELTTESQEMLDEMLDYVTFNRVSNVASHEGITKFEQFGQLLGMTVKDVISDYAKNTGKHPQVQDDWKKLARKLSANCTVVVREFLMSRR